MKPNPPAPPHIISEDVVWGIKFMTDEEYKHTDLLDIKPRIINEEAVKEIEGSEQPTTGDRKTFEKCQITTPSNKIKQQKEAMLGVRWKSRGSDMFSALEDIPK
jgi:hypothetical protein